MSDYTKLSLYPHNIEGYEKVNKALEENKIAAIVRSTGTGKSYIALQYALDHKDEEILCVVPYKGIIEHVMNIIKDSNLDYKKDFHNLKFITYQKIAREKNKDIDKMKIDTLVLDEFHHIGAPIWGGSINRIIKNRPNLKILGMTAYTVRARGTFNERDMVSPGADELFSDKVVSSYTLTDAILDGVLPKPIYKSAYIYYENNLNNIVHEINLRRFPSSKTDKLYQLLVYIRNRLHKAKGVKELFQTSIKKNGKYIYFCPLIGNIDEIKEEVKSWLKEMGLEENKDYCFYVSTHNEDDYGVQARNSFYYDKDLEGNNVKDKLRIMFAINQYNEGTHVPGIDGVIMGRQTSSDIVFYEQLGRGLSTRGDIIRKYEEYSNLSVDELKKLCHESHIECENMTKGEMIERLVSPVIIDLANNLEFIQRLEKEQRIKIEERTKNRIPHVYSKYDLKPSFDVEMLNEDIYHLFASFKMHLSMSWEDYYSLLQEYFDEYGHICIGRTFRTYNGYEYDPQGFKLGEWLIKQKKEYSKGLLSIEKRELLEELPIDWNLQNADIVTRYFNKKLRTCNYEGIDINQLSDEDFEEKYYFDSNICKMYEMLKASSLDEDEEVFDPVNYEDEVIKKLNGEALMSFLDQLKPAQKEVIILRYGLDGGGLRTLDEVGNIIGKTRERVRQIEQKSLRRLSNIISKRWGREVFEETSISDDKQILAMKEDYILKCSKYYDIICELIYFFSKPINIQKENMPYFCFSKLKIPVSQFYSIVDSANNEVKYEYGLGEESYLRKKLFYIAKLVSEERDYYLYNHADIFDEVKNGSDLTEEEESYRGIKY